jgi:hypothetical protein
VPVLGERGMVRNLLIEAKTGEPAPGQVHAEFFHQLAFTGKEIAVAFQAGVHEKGVSVWLAIWDIGSRKILRRAAIESGLTIEQAVNPHSGRDVRYTTDGSLVVVGTGPRVLVLKADELTMLKSIDPIQIDSGPKYGPSILGFDVSDDGRWVAVLTRSVGMSRSAAGLTLVDLKGSTPSVEWVIRQDVGSISLSNDGSRVALTGYSSGSGDLYDVALLDSKTGKELRAFQSGCSNPSVCGASDARFWGNDRIVTVPRPATDAGGRFLATSLRIFDVKTGELIRELSPKGFSSIGAISIARQVPVVATINSWETRSDIRRELGFHHSKPELVFFNLDNGTSRTVLKPVPQGMRSRRDQYSLRLSADASIVALFESATVNVFKLQ